jgi:hypothetical protein
METPDQPKTFKDHILTQYEYHQAIDLCVKCFTKLSLANKRKHFGEDVVADTHGHEPYTFPSLRIIISKLGFIEKYPGLKESLINTATLMEYIINSPEILQITHFSPVNGHCHRYKLIMAYIEDIECICLAEADDENSFNLSMCPQ